MGLMERREYSLAVVRAATMTELLTNYVIRHELKSRHNIPNEFIDELFMWANGITGKWDRLLLKLNHPPDTKSKLSQIYTKVKALNKDRNKIVHSGAFRDRKPAEEMIALAQKITVDLFALYKPGFSLKVPKSPVNRALKKRNK